MVARSATKDGHFLGIPRMSKGGVGGGQNYSGSRWERSPRNAILILSC